MAANEPDEGKAYEQGWKDGFDAGYASADDWLAQHEDAMREHGWIRADEGGLAALVLTVQDIRHRVESIDQDVLRFTAAVRDLDLDVSKVDANALTVYNQRIELGRLNALTNEQAQTIRQLRRELEEARHGSE